MTSIDARALMLNPLTNAATARAIRASLAKIDATVAAATAKAKPKARQRKPKAPPLPAAKLSDFINEISFDVLGIQIESSPNQRLHYYDAARIKAAQRLEIGRFAMVLWLPSPPVDVRITRLFAGRQREFDDDNLAAGAKAVRDAVAELYRIDDGDKARIQFAVDQKRDGNEGVRIRIARRESLEKLEKEAE